VYIYIYIYTVYIYIYLKRERERHDRHTSPVVQWRRHVTTELPQVKQTSGHKSIYVHTLRVSTSRCTD